jgi:hypothetical protein
MAITSNNTLQVDEMPVRCTRRDIGLEYTAEKLAAQDERRGWESRLQVGGEQSGVGAEEVAAFVRQSRSGEASVGQCRGHRGDGRALRA